MAPRSKAAAPPPPEVVEPEDFQLLEKSPDGLLGWDGTKWRPIEEFGLIEDERTEIPANDKPTAPMVETDLVEVKTTVVETPAPVKRGRGRPRKEEVVEDENAPFRPKVTALHATAKRTVRTGQYESFEITDHVEAIPDPRFSQVDNLALLSALVTQQANATAEQVEREVQLGKG